MLHNSGGKQVIFNSIPIINHLSEHRWRLTVASLFLLLLAGAFFIPVLRGYWLADDFYWVRDFLGYDWRELPNLFLGNWSRTVSNEYRPLWAFSFIVDLLFWGPDARGLHLTNILFHIIASALVWYLVRATVQDNGLAALLSLAFFALAPIHAEPVAWISARGHILAPIFILSSVILLRRYPMYGGTSNYLASIGAAVAAFTTQEAAVALPPLLLLKDVVDAPRLNRRWVLRTGVLHAPFWAILGLYLGFRMLVFGKLGREGMLSTFQQFLYNFYFSAWRLWLSPHSIPDAPRIFAGIGIKWLLFILIAIVLFAPFTFLRNHELRNYIRGFIYFAIGWPIVAAIAYFGSNSERHLYLASIGPCVALGLAGARLLTAKRPFPILGSALVAFLFIVYGSALASSVARYAYNGERSLQIKEEIDGAIERASRDTNAIVIVIPEIPDNNRSFWEYFYPAALQPPFAHRTPSVSVISSFTSCHCPPEEWLSVHGISLTRIIHGTTGPIHVVEWDVQQGAFVTNVFSQVDFREAGYVSADGSLLRPRLPGEETISLP